MNSSHLRSTAVMGTVVTIQIVQSTDRERNAEASAAIDRALNWFRAIESTCNRFDPESEIRQLCRQVGVPVRASAMLLEAVKFAVAVAEDADGAFDPTIGVNLEQRGFDREYRSGRSSTSGIDPTRAVSYRDVRVDAHAETITLLTPLLLDLGAVAKGLAVDMAARELEPYEHFAIDAGGDLYVAGLNPERRAWSVGIRHPREPGQCIETLHLSNAAICTSGDYERPGSTPAGGHHILDPRTGESAAALASVTVIARRAIVADALATAAFVMGPERGLAWLTTSGVEGLLITPALDRFSTPGLSSASILPNA